MAKDGGDQFAAAFEALSQLNKSLESLTAAYRAVCRERDALLRERNELRGENDRLVLHAKRPVKLFRSRFNRAR